MPDGTGASPSATTFARSVFYAASALTLVLLLFPPFTSMNGTEHAFVLTGPEWSRSLGALGSDLGLEARIHWMALLAQLAALWAVALGATSWFRPALGAPRPSRRGG
jgi:hypothetical protein